MKREEQAEKYLIIPRKYRPQTFEDVVGQEAIVTTLKNSLSSNRLAHAYLFCGSRGTGKTTLARVFAKALNCSHLAESYEPCCECTSCQEIASGCSLDVLEIDGASHRGIDDIRQINETVGYAPSSGKYKIYIIDEVHMLTKEAFNALLKTLEEPPPSVKFFFATTEPYKVLPTIISRCQRFDLSRISTETMNKKLAWIAKDLKVEIEEGAIRLITHLSEGSLRDAESLLDQIFCYAEEKPITAEKIALILGLTSQESFFTLDHAIHSGNTAFAFELANMIFSKGKDLSYFVEGLLEHYRNILLFKLQGEVSFFTPSDKKKYTASACLYTEEHCLYILDFLLHWFQQISKTPFKRISLEMILLHLIRSRQRIPLEAIVKKLADLEQSILSSDCPSPFPHADPLFKELPKSIESSSSTQAIFEPSHTSVEEKLIKEIPPCSEPENKSLDAICMAMDKSVELSDEICHSKPFMQDNRREHELIETIKQKIACATPPDLPSIPESNVKEDVKNQEFEIIKESFPISTEKQELSASESFQQQVRYDTLMRFAAVELEGSFKKI